MLLEKENVFDFDVGCKKAFLSLQEKLISSTIIIAPDWSLPFEMMSDASGVALATIFGQHKNKLFHPIYYAIKK
ncbi:hypothetical protein MTR67_012686 [Solanum verrucosum]|uniref:Reverse transcriptase/retrotransposon-derived protein RNase H-like domain-containing protein n=1 Tax=Solanum verrucosum TaxID=315347 RepID=A0AAF0QEY7_SOLVR|nr:hypothetical protein MTR67_012686 [Solanum verrucosum]